MLALLLSLNLFADLKVIPSDLKKWEWHQSTLLGGFVKPENDLSIERSVQGPNGPLKVRIWKTQDSKGLYVLIPGTGADADSGNAGVLAETIYKNGFDVLILANPFVVDFQNSFSSDGLIGFPQKDKPDIYNMIFTALNQFSTEFGEPKSLNITGFSLGGFYVEMLRPELSRIGFKKFIALNPPLNFSHAMHQLDELIRIRMDEDPSLLDLLDQLIPLFRLVRKGLNKINLLLLKERIGDNEDQNKYLIGRSFQSVLKRILEETVKREPFRSEYRGTRILLNKDYITFSKFLGYVGVVVGVQEPLKGKTLADLVEELDLIEMINQNGNSENLYVFTNGDDFLNTKKQLKSLVQNRSVKTFVFKDGGHCGNYWTPSFIKEFGRVLSAP